jgi:hypothetical protein
MNTGFRSTADCWVLVLLSGHGAAQLWLLEVCDTEPFFISAVVLVPAVPTLSDPTFPIDPTSSEGTVEDTVHAFILTKPSSALLSHRSLTQTKTKLNRIRYLNKTCPIKTWTNAFFI